MTKGQELGRTGATGLAGGDHLHFTMLLQGTPVNPVEWWDQHWMQDRVLQENQGSGGVTLFQIPELNPAQISIKSLPTTIAPLKCLLRGARSTSDR